MSQNNEKLQKIDEEILTALTKIPKNPIEDVISKTLVTSNTASLQKSKTLMMWLIVASPSNVRGTVLPISSATIIGRHGDVIWYDAHMSRKHALFSLMNNPENPDEQLFTITPYKDRNGTLVNGKRISERTLLRENDVILMGDTQFVVKMLL